MCDEEGIDDAAFDTPHGAEPTRPRDVRRLRSPSGHGAEARAYDHLFPAQGDARILTRTTVVEQLVEHGELTCVELTLQAHEVLEFRVELPHPRQALEEPISPKRRERRAAA